MKYLRLFVVLVGFLVVINSPIDLLSDVYDNIPVKVNTQNSFTFTLSAKDFTYSTTDDLVFLNDSLVVTITMANVTSSNSSCKLYNSSNVEIFGESLNESKVVVNTDLIGDIPDKIKIELIDFTGQLTIVVALDQN